MGRVFRVSPNGWVVFVLIDSLLYTCKCIN